MPACVATCHATSISTFLKLVESCSSQWTDVDESVEEGGYDWTKARSLVIRRMTAMEIRQTRGRWIFNIQKYLQAIHNPCVTQVSPTNLHNSTKKIFLSLSLSLLPSLYIHIQSTSTSIWYIVYGKEFRKCYKLHEPWKILKENLNILNERHWFDSPVCRYPLKELDFT